MSPPTTLPPAETTTTSGIDPDDVGFVEGECPLVTESEVEQALGIDDVGDMVIPFIAFNRTDTPIDVTLGPPG